MAVCLDQGYWESPGVRPGGECWWLGPNPQGPAWLWLVLHPPPTWGAEAVWCNVSKVEVLKFFVTTLLIFGVFLVSLWLFSVFWSCNFPPWNISGPRGIWQSHSVMHLLKWNIILTVMRILLWLPERIAGSQQHKSFGSEQWEQTAKTTADSCNEGHSHPAAVMKTERHVSASKPPQANTEHTTPNSGKVTLILLRISPALQG